MCLPCQLESASPLASRTSLQPARPQRLSGTNPQVRWLLLIGWMQLDTLVKQVRTSVQPNRTFHRDVSVPACQRMRRNAEVLAGNGRVSPQKKGRVCIFFVFVAPASCFLPRNCLPPAQTTGKTLTMFCPRRSFPANKFSYFESTSGIY